MYLLVLIRDELVKVSDEASGFGQQNPVTTWSDTKNGLMRKIPQSVLTLRTQRARLLPKCFSSSQQRHFIHPQGNFRRVLQFLLFSDKRQVLHSKTMWLTLQMFVLLLYYYSIIRLLFYSYWFYTKQHNYLFQGSLKKHSNSNLLPKPPDLAKNCNKQPKKKIIFLKKCVGCVTEMAKCKKNGLI